jgi:hypothetical protein
VARQCGVPKMVSIEEARRRLVGHLLEKVDTNGSLFVYCYYSFENKMLK